MRFTLQQLVAGAIAEATEREKLAQADAKSEGGDSPPKDASEKSDEKKKKKPPFAAKESDEGEGKEKESSGLKCASVETDLVDALVGLGYRPAAARRAVAKVGKEHPDAAFADRLKESLAFLSGR